MLPVLACAAALCGLASSQVGVLQPARLRTLLPNGSAVLVEDMPQSRYTSIQLFVSSRLTRDTPTTSGYRHLLEHLEARADGKLDWELESKGAFLYARTFRDFTVFEVRVKPTDLDLGLRSLARVMKMPQLSPEIVAKECAIIEQEEALEDLPMLGSKAAWDAAYGADALDPLGNLEAMRSATAGGLREIHDKEFSGKCLALTVVGPLDLDDATRRASAILEAAPKFETPDGPLRGPAKPVDLPTVRAAPVPAFSEPLTAWSLAAGLALASDMEGGYLAYTPSCQKALMILGSAESQESLPASVDQADAATLFPRGRILARKWVSRQLASASGDGFLRGALLVQDPSARPEDLLDNLKTMTFPQFQKALAAFQRAGK